MITVKLFGVLRLDSGVKELVLDVKTVREIFPFVLEEARRLNPGTKVTKQDVEGCIIAVNCKKAGPRTKLKSGDVVYLAPAVAGG
ncbi:MAG: MoaD/ThiS family protein [Ruminococcaceae bacterium]|nr:MoaD/ThiS family protein [Oscillospiraceae bacterium]